MSSINPIVMLLLGMVLGWLAAWYLQRQPEVKERTRVQQLEDELGHFRQELTKVKAELMAARAPAAPPAFTAAAARYTPPSLEPVAPAAAVSEGVDEAAARLATYRAAMTPAAEAAAPAVMVAADQAESPIDQPSGAVQVEAVAQPSAEPAPLEPAPGMQAASPAVSTGEADDLTRIKGIGKKYAATLAANGITTYAGLAAATPEHLRAIIQPAEWQKLEFADWIAQAQQLARQRRRVRIGDDLTRLEGIGPAYAQRLRAGGIITFAQLAASNEQTLAGLVAAQPWQRVRFDEWISQAKLAAAGDEAGLRDLQAELFSRKGDNLTLIHGLGEQSAAALTAAGFATFLDLAAARPDQVEAALEAAGLRRGNAAAWIDEARRRAAGRRITRGGAQRSRLAFTEVVPCPQDLGAVRGIGQIYEQRLYNAGVGSYWEVGMIPAAELAEILEVQGFQGVDLAAIQAEAMQLATSTGTLGRIWDGTEPDDFESLEGVGEVFERRLYAAGICTYAALAAASVERLAGICPAMVGRRPDYAHWIEQARMKVQG